VLCVWPFPSVGALQEDLGGRSAADVRLVHKTSCRCRKFVAQRPVQSGQTTSRSSWNAHYWKEWPDKKSHADAALEARKRHEDYAKL